MELVNEWKFERWYITRMFTYILSIIVYDTTTASVLQNFVTSGIITEVKTLYY